MNSGGKLIDKKKYKGGQNRYGGYNSDRYFACVSKNKIPIQHSSKPIRGGNASKPDEADILGYVSIGACALFAAPGGVDWKLLVTRSQDRIENRQEPRLREFGRSANIHFTKYPLVNAEK